MRRFVSVALALGALLITSCSGDKTKNQAGGVTLPPAGSAPPASGTPEQASKVNVCAFFSEGRCPEHYGRSHEAFRQD